MHARRFRWTCLALLLAPLPALAAALHIAREAQWLAARHDLDSRVAAAALLGLTQPTRAQALLHRAALDTPRAVDLALFDTTTCRALEGCDARARERRLRRLDPDNGAAWLQALHRARRRQDPARVGRALAAMARAEHFNLYLNRLAQRIDAALATLPQPGLPAPQRRQRDAVAALSLVAARALPGLQDIVRACRGAAAGGLRWQRCQRLGKRMRHGDSLIANQIGLQLGTWTATDAGTRRTMDRARQVLAWQQQQLGRLERHGRSSVLLDVSGRYPSEAAAMAAALRRAGRPLQPPPGWRGPDPHRS